MEGETARVLSRYRRAARCVSSGERNCSGARLKMQFPRVSTSSRTHRFINNRHSYRPDRSTPRPTPRLPISMSREIGYLNYDLRLVICARLSGHFAHKSVVEHPYAANSVSPSPPRIFRRPRFERVLRMSLH